MTDSDDMEKQKACPALGGGRRPAAGEDPVKREQILDGAHRVFMRMGFDAASMNDITREAGVSKGTLYVYFADKEALFTAIVQRQKLRVHSFLTRIAAKDAPIEEVMLELGIAFTTHLLAEDAVRAMRIIIGVAERMPALTQVFMATGPNRGPQILAEFFQRQAASGHLRNIDDFHLAARQFGDLCLAGFFRPRLFGEMTEPPSAAAIEANVRSAITMFLNTYGA